MNYSLHALGGGGTVQQLYALSDTIQCVALEYNSGWKPRKLP